MFTSFSGLSVSWDKSWHIKLKYMIRFKQENMYAFFFSFFVHASLFFNKSFTTEEKYGHWIIAAFLLKFGRDFN